MLAWVELVPPIAAASRGGPRPVRRRAGRASRLTSI